MFQRYVIICFELSYNRNVLDTHLQKLTCCKTISSNKNYKIQWPCHYAAVIPQNPTLTNTMLSFKTTPINSLVWWRYVVCVPLQNMNYYFYGRFMKDSTQQPLVAIPILYSKLTIAASNNPKPCGCLVILILVSSCKWLWRYGANPLRTAHGHWWVHGQRVCVASRTWPSKRKAVCAWACFRVLFIRLLVFSMASFEPPLD